MPEEFESQLVWKWSSHVSAMRGDSHGGGYAPEPAYLEDFELDREATDVRLVDEWDNLDIDEQGQIEQRAHCRELDKI